MDSFFMITGDITDKTYARAVRFFAGSAGVVNLIINSTGGSTIDALAIASIIRRYSASNAAGVNNVNAAVYGCAFSAATIILAACSKRRMAKEAYVMVHDASVKLKGSVSCVRSEAQFWDRVESDWNMLLESRTKTSTSRWAELSSRETYLSANECLELGLIDEVI